MGDLSAAPAIYYTTSKSYALAWGTYKIPPIGWQKDNIDGVIIFEAKLTSTNLSKVQLEDSDQMQNVHSLYLF